MQQGGKAVSSGVQQQAPQQPDLILSSRVSGGLQSSWISCLSWAKVHRPHSQGVCSCSMAYISSRAKDHRVNNSEPAGQRLVLHRLYEI